MAAVFIVSHYWILLKCTLPYTESLCLSFGLFSFVDLGFCFPVLLIPNIVECNNPCRLPLCLLNFIQKATKKCPSYSIFLSDSETRPANTKSLSATALLWLISVMHMNVIQLLIRVQKILKANQGFGFFQVNTNWSLSYFGQTMNFF